MASFSLFTTDWSACGATDANSPAQLSCVGIVLQNLINAALALAAITAVILIIYSGLQYVMSSGDKEKIDAARKRLTYAIIGLVFIVMSWTILVLISQFTGVGLNQITTIGGSGVTPNPTIGGNPGTH